ncbi:XRE family transcriptional regulator [Archangium sp.]|uniref:XRE family transcriptional regulator n=1 Tax=Archangium sp. TaxID=1872627 RepID=UPI002D323CFE|nr:XRE family transcriptional regulator [Archangium sp.]HYO53268.1 XRE family transcriptional regulator [Archangium sp.]
MISSEQLGERIAQARKRLNKTQDQLARSIGVARTTLVAMEKGERRPTNAELLKLAQELSTSLNELLREHTVVADASPRFRIAPRHARSDAVEEAVERLKALGRQYVELEQVLSVSRTPAPLEAITAYRASHSPAGMEPRLAAQDAAAFLRRQLDLGDGPVLALESLLELEAGLRIFQLPLPSEVAAIFLWSDTLGACVALNRNQPRERRRWSLVHELGHFLRDREAGDVLPARFEGRLDPSEIFSETLAAEFLMPATGVRRRFAEHLRDKGAHFSAADLIAMARFYAVSFQAMTLRLEELQLLSAGTYRKLVQRNFRPLAAQKQMGLKPVRENTERWLPQRYERLALEAYAQELLSEGELARYLHCDRVMARELYLTRQVEATEGGELVLDLGEDVLGSRSAG